MRELLTGWGRTAPTAADVSRPTTAGQLVTALAGAPARGVIARGLGRSYGDAAQNAGGSVVSTVALDGVEWADEQAGLVRASGGTSLEAVQRFLVPRGWALPVLPGTRHVTVGGAVAADVHGKNHPVDGSFGGHVAQLTLALPDGVHRASPTEDPDLFWATVGGLGLTGVVLDAVLRARPVETAFVRVVTRRLADLDAVLAAMDAAAGRHRYAVAWLDVMARGRGIVAGGDHAAAGDLSLADRRAPLALHEGRHVTVPS